MLKDSKGITHSFRLFRDCEIGLQDNFAQNGQSNLIQAQMDDDVDTDDDVMSNAKSTCKKDV